MGNMVTNVGAKFTYDRLSIDKVLGNWKSEKKNNKNKGLGTCYSAAYASTLEQ